MESQRLFKGNSSGYALTILVWFVRNIPSVTPHEWEF